MRPPRRITPAGSAVELVKSMTALPGVEVASRVSVAPGRAELTVAPVMLRKAELYCRVNLPEVTAAALLRLSGMPAARLLGKLTALPVRRAKPGMPTTLAGVALTMKVV